MKTLLGWSVLAATLTASAFASADQPVTQTSKTTTVESTTGTPSATPAPAPGTATTTPSNAVPTNSSIVTSESTTTTTTPATPPVITTPTSTTTVTSADDSALPPPSSTTPPPRDTTTIYKKSTPNKAVLITGGAMFVGSYATTAALAGASDTERDKHLYIPVAGPWMALGQNDFSTRDTVLIAGSGVLQGAGIGLMVASLFIPEKVAAATISAGNTKFNLAPASFGVGSAGASAVGSF